ncbi:MAG TPA: MlaD family protein [Solirubrobacteraceae bacterium]|nr:MlaD family protein [Solirubrobacteraceae bacterium]
MIKTAPSPLRITALLAFVLSCAVVLIFLWISFGGSIPFAARGYRMEVAFPEANELATGADVRIAGVNVGKVVALRPDAADSRTLATLELSRQYAPRPHDTRATLRIKTLLGETYVDLSAGNRSSGELRDGGKLPDGQVEPQVTLDQILSTFDPKTRAAFQTWMQSQAGAVTGRGQDINTSFYELPPFFGSANGLLSALHHQSAAVRGLVANTGEFFNAISARRGELSGLITAANNLFQTTAKRNVELANLFKALPEFELQSRLTLPALTTFAKRADPVVRALLPLAPQLERTFALTEQLSPYLRTLFDRLGPVVTASQRGLPALDRILTEIRPLLGAFGPFLRNADPMVRYIGEFKRNVTAFFGNATDAAQASIGYGPGQGAPFIHFLRTSQTLSPAALAFLSRPLGLQRDNAYRSPGAFNNLASGLSVLDPALCSNGNPAPPVSANPTNLVKLIETYVFRTTGRNVPAPPCHGQGTIPGFGTLFPHLQADPPPSVARR